VPAAISSVLGVGSWDHLTTKGLIHEMPDRIVVWNELQRTEAAELHGARPRASRRDRSAGVRSLVRDAAVDHTRGVLLESRSACEEPLSPLPVFVAIHRAV
jgi:hypothetical protein